MYTRTLFKADLVSPGNQRKFCTNLPLLAFSLLHIFGSEPDSIFLSALQEIKEVQMGVLGRGSWAGQAWAPLKGVPKAWLLEEERRGRLGSR